MSGDNQRMREFHHRLLELNGGKWFDFEPHLAAFYRGLLRPGSVAVDGGANMGLHTFRMAEMVLPNGRVVAIEPLPEMVADLRTRIRDYQLPEQLIQVVPYGLFSAPGEADFYQVLDPIQHEMSGLRNRHLFNDDQIKQIRIELTTLDIVCKDLDRIDFIKLDLEGAEMDALHGGRQTISRLRPVLAIEQDQHSPQHFDYTWEDLLEYFNLQHYDVYDLFGLRYTEPTMFEQCAVWDFVGLPVEYPKIDALFEGVRHSMEAMGVTFELASAPQHRPPAPGSRDLTPTGKAPVYAFDYLGPVREPLTQKSIHVRDDMPISFSGWAVDEESAAGGVDIVIDGVPYGALYGRYRDDVAGHFKNIACQNSGFLLLLPSGTLSKGDHVAALRVITSDRQSYYQGPTIAFTID